MIVFYSDIVDDTGGILNNDEARHCTKVLRKKQGEHIIVLNGKGDKYECKITGISRDEVTFDIISKQSELLQSYLPTIAISILNNPSRLEWFLEKTTEIGVNEIHPLICDRTQKKNFRLDRAKSIVISAMKQSLRTHLPKVSELKKLKEIIIETTFVQKFICNYNSGNPHLYDMLELAKPSYILIGPEGDFTDTELALAKKEGFLSVNISNTRLRTETAGIMACQIVSVKNRNL